MIIVANYKMNLGLDSYKLILKKLNNINYKDTNLVLCPPFVYLQHFSKNKTWFNLGAQDVSASANNKCTGQISASMLKEFDVSYVLVGHSDRRHFESNEDVSNKVVQAVNCGITPIICVGENKKDEPDNMLIEQIKTALARVEKNSKIIIAYEPVWSISSGDVPTNSYINKKVATIKRETKKLGFNLPILYGGSVDENNCLALKKCKIDGFLIGRLSLKIDKFLTLLERV